MLIRAYTDQLSYERGRDVQLHVSGDEADASVSLVRLLDAGTGEPSRDRPVQCDLPATVRIRPQETAVGSFMVGSSVPGSPTSSPEVTLGAFVWFGRVAAPVQTIVSLGSAVRLELRDGGVALSIDENVVAQCPPMNPATWYLVTGSLENGAVLTRAVPLDPCRGGALEAHGQSTCVEVDLTAPITVAAHSPERIVAVENGARGLASGHYSGKIEAPFVGSRVLGPAAAESIARGGRSPHEFEELDLVAAWDLAPRNDIEPGIGSAALPGQPDALLVNGPARGVTGRTFSGKRLSFVDAPDEYAAVNFHSTDLLDAGWETTLSFTLPDTLDSGVYGIRVATPDATELVPVTVVPRATDVRRDVVVVLPTFTYLAYANEEMFADSEPERLEAAGMGVPQEEWDRAGDRSYGLSLYDTHRDGSGVMTSSARRHITNMRRGYGSWIVGGGGRNFSSDMSLIEWFDRTGIAVDVITDRELHERGAEYLRSYAVVVSGSHPEYTTEDMLDTLLEYRDGGGRLAYLGGNGWYWVTAVQSTSPLVVEIRRGQSGIRKWESLPGEVTLYSTGEPGGLWRHRGRAPQILVGVGFAAQGWNSAAPYRRQPAAQLPEFAWVFDGVESDPIGDYGSVMGGAAGDEIDRADHALGTPPDAVVLASSTGLHTNMYQRVVEEIPMNRPNSHGGEEDSDVRADIVYFSTPGGGEVFSTGSIAWCGSLLHDGGSNGVSRMTENVLREFVRRARAQRG
ncbi:hypothetical protein CYJ73_24795 [Gordonia terrae]|uniref:N,N-dimethylformamidase beta subunit-like C-terminal domain-containing protein n=1 Tax=Gordonia terrae TaxID=2055 RepID=A0A2I1R182_9ACTN|nr:hypothetical protein CYJ73_24795 [Gordonia terrae]